MSISPSYARSLDLERGAVDMTHGAGGLATEQLIREVFAKHFRNDWLEQGHDGALLPALKGNPVFSSDGHVVKPLFFPGGDIGRLAVAGTVNDVAVCGAKPLYLSASFILEEGLPLSTLDKIVRSMAETAREAGVAIVTGDTKVVEKGHGDGLYVATSGIGEKIVDYVIDGRKARPGDAVLVTGTIGDHGTAILSERESLGFETEVVSDAAPLNRMIETLLAAVPVVHVLRDPTRGGVAATLNEIAHQSGVGVELDERSLPVRPAVAAACEFLGLDPLYVANEGKLLVILPEEHAEKALVALRSDPHGADAAVIGRITEEHAGVVEMTTLPGGKRLVDWLHGEQLPRLC